MSYSHSTKSMNNTTAHPWCDGHSTNISACWVWRGKGQGSNFQKGVLHTYTLRLSQSRILSCIKKKKSMNNNNNNKFNANSNCYDPNVLHKLNT